MHTYAHTHTHTWIRIPCQFKLPHPSSNLLSTWNPYMINIHTHKLTHTRYHTYTCTNAHAYTHMDLSQTSRAWQETRDHFWTIPPLFNPTFLATPLSMIDTHTNTQTLNVDVRKHTHNKYTCANISTRMHVYLWYTHLHMYTHVYTYNFLTHLGGLTGSQSSFFRKIPILFPVVVNRGPSPWSETKKKMH